jgi:uncharacterized protein YgiM (DUF1202 family)
MKKRIGFYSALFAAILLFTGCASLEKKDAVPAESSRSENLAIKEPTSDSQKALPRSSPDTNAQLPQSAPDSSTKSALLPSAPNPIPAPETLKTEKPAVTYLITTKNGCNIRSEPKEKSKRITTLNRGEKLQKIGQLENWYNIILPSGKKGWIYKDLVKNAD